VSESISPASRTITWELNWNRTDSDGRRQWVVGKPTSTAGLSVSWTR